ncbi:MAG: hypothetical protein LC623_08315 [Halobacteriales archaeon]|nr:hypothetical protein [Halobacteriales archaeon]
MHKTLSRLLILTLAASLAAVVVAPVASAQGPVKPQFTFGLPTVDKSTLVADVDVGKITVPGKFTFNTPGTVAGAVAIQSAILKYTKEPSCDKAGTSIIGPTSTPIDLSKATGGTQTFDTSSSFSISATQLAPGETDIKCSFTAKVTALQNNAYSDTDEQSTSLLVKVKFLGLLTANVPNTIVEAGPQKEIRYEIELTNLGNSLTNVNFNLAGETPEGWSPVPPTPIIMQSQQQGGTEFAKKVNFLIQTPHKNGWNNDEKTFQLKIQPSSTKDPDQKGNEIAVNVLARVRGIYVPGPEPFLLVAALLGAAMVARLVRRAD